MNSYTPESAAAALRNFLDGGSVFVLTGAGMSTDSGIPDYRKPDGTRRVIPMTYSEFTATAAARRRYWLRSTVGWQRFSQAQSNSAHSAVAGWEKADLLSQVVTQNVDGLHHRAGSANVIELHGNLARVVCLECGERMMRADFQQELTRLNPSLPTVSALLADGDADVDTDLEATFVLAGCSHCGSTRVKTDVVMFGESVAADVVANCFEALERSRAILVLGSSLQVMSGYRFVLAARAAGKPVGLVGLGTIRGAEKANLVLPVPLLPTLTLAGADL